MISGYLVGDTEVIKRLSAMPEKLRFRLGVAVNRLGTGLQRRIRMEKLSGQVLHRKSGTLSRSIDQSPLLTTANSVMSVVSTNVKYARKHEYGFHGTETVKAHMRMMKVAFGRPVANPRKIEVQSFTRKVDFPERSFMRSALREMRPEINEKISIAVNESIR